MDQIFALFPVPFFCEFCSSLFLYQSLVSFLDSVIVPFAGYNMFLIINIILFNL